jgi:hypothetical protein
VSKLDKWLKKIILYFCLKENKIKVLDNELNGTKSSILLENHFILNDLCGGCNEKINWDKGKA